MNSDNDRNLSAAAPGKQGAERINPYDNSRNKGEQVEEMFDSIAPAYDFMNKAMTLGLHVHWRNRALHDAIEQMHLDPKHDARNLREGIVTTRVLDVATGTGDVAFRLHELLPHARIVGIDLSAGMLGIARAKLDAMPDGTSDLLAFGKADCMNLPYNDGEFHLITVAYGVRNFENLLQGLKEMRRVLAPGGVLCIVELSVPTASLTKAAYKLYTRRLIPTIGKMVSGDSRAYTYLPESIAAAPQRDEMVKILRKAGFKNARWKSLTFGAVTYYIAY